jgi:hypothetical protein
MQGPLSVLTKPCSFNVLTDEVERLTASGAALGKHQLAL